MKKSMRNMIAFAICGSMMLFSFAACGESSTSISEGNVPAASAGTATSSSSQNMSMSSGETSSLTGGSAAVPTALMPQASGKVTKGNSSVTIDASNTADGYVMVKYLEQTSRKLKLIIAGPDSVRYTYNITKIGSYETFPLSGGSGKYTVTVYRNVSGDQYSTVYSTTFNASLKDEFAPFLLPNQYVNYTTGSSAVKLAASLTTGKTSDLEKIQAVYDWVVKNISYDRQLAASVQSGYLPDLDKLIVSKKGICFDYASLMTGMLRSQSIPCKLVIGYSGKAYHAWINTYTAENGWINGVIYFDGTSWKLMDPTFASTGNQSRATLSYIGDATHYTAKYLY